VTAAEGDLIVAGDINRGGIGDFEILVRGVTSLSRDDFIL
jgi:hypothetical protein